MKLFTKKFFLSLALAVLGPAILSACGGAGSCTNCSSNSNITPPNIGGLDNISMVAPSSYPAGVAVTIPVVVTNNGAESINNLSYAIDAASNTTGGTITIEASSATSCRAIAAKASCTLNAEIAATPISHPGSFSITTTHGVAQSGIDVFRTFLASSVLSVNVNIGLAQMPTNRNIGADGLTLYYPSSVVGIADGATQFIVTAVITSEDAAGLYNMIQLVDGNGNPLNYTVLSGNIGTGMTNLAYGSVVSFLLTVPSGSSQVQFKAKASHDGSAASTSTNSNTVVVTNPATPVGIMNIFPNYFNLTPNNDNQIITLSNSGNGPISNLGFTVTSPFSELSNNCGTTLAAGATCQYVIKFNKDIPISGTGGVVVNYNNGNTEQSATATVNYTGVDPIAGLTITSDNPNFDFITRTKTPSQTSVVTLTNSGNSDETGFNFGLVTYFTTNTTGIVNPCSSSTILTPGASCSINLVYNNSTELSATTSEIPVSYQYGKSFKTATSSILVTYTTIQSVAILDITPNPATFLGIVDNGVDSNIQTFSVTNSGDETATLLSTTFSGNNAALFSAVNNASNPCGASLATNTSCSQDVKFGPTIETAGSKTASLNINYIPYTNAITTTSASLIGQVSGAQGAIINQGIPTASGFASGTGLDQANQYQVAQSAASPTLSYTITNTGAMPANNFNVSGVASSGWSYNGCGANGGSPVTLAANGGSCTLTFTLEDTATVSAHNLDLSALTMNWIDQDSPSGQSQPMIGILYVNVFTPAVITISPSTATLTPGANATFTVNLAGGYQVADQTISLNDASSATDGITISPAQCVVNSTTSSCSFMVQTSVNTPSVSYPLTVGYGSITPNITTLTLRVLSSAQTQMLLAQSSAYGCMLKVTTNVAYCWGSNRNGELGNGTNVNTATPTAVLIGGSSAIPVAVQLTGITAGSATSGYASSCIISADGNMYCWGYGGQGALGNNSYTTSNKPVAVLKGAPSAISNDTILTFASTCGSNSCTVDSTGNAYCWGYGGNGQLGNNSYTSSSVPVAVLKGGSSAITSSTQITSISIGYHYGCAVDSVGDAYCWGQNPKGNFGNNTTVSSNIPVKVLKGGASAIGVSEKIIQISVTKDHSSYLELTTCAVTDLGNAYCWGYNTKGAIGNNSTINSSVPVLVLRGSSGSAIPLSAKFTNIETSGQTTCAVASGLGYCWGQNQRGQVGDNSTTMTSVAKSVIVGGSSAIPSGISFLNIGTGFDDAYSNAMSSCAQGSDNKFYCWGDNTYGELGGGTIGTPPYSTLPVRVLIP